MMLKLAKKYKNLVVLSSGLSPNLQEFVKFFPDRYFSFGRAHANIAGVSAGFALRGKIPVVVCDENFISRAFEQIKSCICEPNLNVKIFGGDEGLELVKILPNMKVFSGNIDEAFLEYGPAYVIKSFD